MHKFLDDNWIEGLIRELTDREGFSDLSDSEQFDEVDSAIAKQRFEIRDELVNRAGQNLHDSLVSHRLQIDEFEARLHQRWYRSFDLLEVIVGSLGEIGEELNRELRSAPTSENWYSVEVVTRIHARSLRVARELLCLVTRGYADGAFARWRGMHELAAIGFVVVNSGEETAKRFFEYQVIDAYEGARVHREHADALGIPGPTDDEWEDLQKQRQRLIDQYGKRYAKAYGWIAHLVEDGRRCTFAEVEKLAGISHLKPYYSMASRSMHSTPRGLFYDIGMFQDQGQDEVLAAGPSNYGLADPVQFCAISLLHSTVAVIQLRPTIRGIAAIEAAEVLIDKLQEVATQIQKDIEDEEQESEDFGSHTEDNGTSGDIE